MDEDEIIALCQRERIVDPSGQNDIARHVRYMLNPSYFNKTPAARYLEVCQSLDRARNLINELNLESDRVLDDGPFAELREKGYTRRELLALGYLYVARKCRET